MKNVKNKNNIEIALNYNFYFDHFFLNQNGMIFVSFDCYEIQFSNHTKTIRIGFVFPEKSSKI